MANQETAYGLRPIGLVGSAVNSTGVTQYEIATDDTNAIYQYEIVVPLATGVIGQSRIAGHLEQLVRVVCNKSLNRMIRVNTYVV